MGWLIGAIVVVVIIVIWSIKGKQSEATYETLETTEGVYEGDIVNGKPHGKGVFSFHEGSRAWEHCFDDKIHSISCE